LYFMSTGSLKSGRGETSRTSRDSGGRSDRTATRSSDGDPVAGTTMNSEKTVNDATFNVATAISLEQLPSQAVQRNAGSGDRLEWSRSRSSSSSADKHSSTSTSKVPTASSSRSDASSGKDSIHSDATTKSSKKSREQKEAKPDSSED